MSERPRTARAGWLLSSAIIACALIWCAGTPARAADFPAAFVVADVPVDATGQTPATARDAAQLDGERRAFRQLLERLTAKSDWGRLPAANDAQLGQVVQDFEVVSERALATRYVGRYTFRFNPRETRRLLQSANIPFTELASKPVVIVPVLKTAGQVRLWDDPNPWRAAWNAANHKSGLVPFAVPIGDLGDVQAFDVSAASAPKPEQIAALSNRYGGGDPVVVIAAETTAGSDTVLDITATRYGLTGTDTATARAQAPKAGGEPYASAVGAVLRALEENWKQATISHGGSGTLVVSVPVAGGLADWIGVRDRLARIVTIKGQDVLFLSKDEVRVQLRFTGDPGQLRIACAQQDLILAQADPFWTLRRRAAAETAAAPGSVAAPVAGSTPSP
ncbi:MAG TPA: DUF2066 domain-containing protein [Stellaceae bacterium]|nr:DUF2066 domain-containing protein [Stellaceae bacterium]